MTAEAMERPLRRRVSSAGAWSMGQFGASLGVRMVSNMILTRLLLPEAFGVMAVVGVLTVALALLSDLGIGQNVIVHKRGSDPTFLNTAWTVQIARGFFIWSLAIVLAIVISVLAPLGVFAPDTVYVDPRLPLVLVAGTFAAVLQGLESTRIHEARRNLQLRRLTELEFGAQMAGFVVTLALAYTWPSIWALVLGALFAAFIRMAASHLVLPGHANRIGWDRDSWTEIFGFGRWIFVSSLIGVLFTTGDRLILGGLVDAHVLGLYAIAALLLSVFQTAVNTLAGTVAFPALSELARTDTAAFRKSYFTFQAGADAVLGLCAGGLFVTGPLIVSILYDPRYAESGAMLSLLAVGLVGMKFCVTEQCYMATKRMGYYLCTNAIRLVVLVVGLPVGHSLFGLEGALAAIVAAQFSSWPIAYAFKIRHNLFDWRFEGVVIPAVALGLLLGYLVLAGARALGWAA
ncbi:hypothetical protein LA66_11940 [Aureimonas altamirensis]|uniref:Polysaccharide biosynthesis protein n=1 Tax=Aureimonas altamirensis TaxID=370622 RepID=A0A0B1Q1F2_9HYPH|nr:oligosaccharide flippase family protein [Aureimonas altamirensis]KHJ54174.1 hypothetical protein LA66_11940 [Aureimonas altamirensis]